MLLFVAWRGVKNATRELGNKQQVYQLSILGLWY